MMKGNKAVLHHAAIYVKDIKWMVGFFEEVFGMAISSVEGDIDRPNQVWLNGGIQMIARPDGNECGIAHLGIETDQLEETLDRAYQRGATELPKGRNWMKLPGGLVLEILPAK